MKSAIIAAALAAGAMSLAGCATITEGKTDSVAVTSVPVDGAKCSLKNQVGEWYLTTPGSAVVHKSKSNLEIDCTMDGYQAAHTSMPASFENMTAGNMLIGGIIGVGVDAASGAMYHYDKSTQITLVPVTPAAAAMPAPAPTATPAPPDAPASAPAPAKPSS
jgi:hypothetical protein